jgi:hypothetical protein
VEINGFLSDDLTLPSANARPFECLTPNISNSIKYELLIRHLVIRFTTPISLLKLEDDKETRDFQQLDSVSAADNIRSQNSSDSEGCM